MRTLNSGNAVNIYSKQTGLQNSRLNVCEISGFYDGEYGNDSLMRYSINHSLDDGGSAQLCNVCLLQRDYTALHHRRLSTLHKCLRNFYAKL
jgi:hypothetical protein